MRVTQLADPPSRNAKISPTFRAGMIRDRSQERAVKEVESGEVRADLGLGLPLFFLTNITNGYIYNSWMGMD